MKRVKRRGQTSTVRITGCIASYPHLVEPRAAAAGAIPKYSVELILPADLDQEDRDTLSLMINEAAQQQWPNGAPQNCHMPISVIEDGKFQGQWKIRASSSAYNRTHPYAPDKAPLPPPPVVTENPKVRANNSDVYPGCGVAAYLACSAYDNVSKGIGFYVNILQITDRTAPRIDGRASAEEIFDEVEPAFADAEAAQPTVPGTPLPVSPAPHQPTPAAAPPAPTATVPPGAPAATAPLPPLPGLPGGAPGPSALD